MLKITVVAALLLVVNSVQARDRPIRPCKKPLASLKSRGCLPIM